MDNASCRPKPRVAHGVGKDRVLLNQAVSPPQYERYQSKVREINEETGEEKGHIQGQLACNVAEGVMIADFREGRQRCLDLESRLLLQLHVHCRC